ncbi:MAG: OmpA family protein [Burkholderiales bacterium]|nr:OmpA family protein [Burkholderiales bacterium]MDE2077823.1 OmpA family protein [Burkholderiales bacterium]
MNFRMAVRRSTVAFGTMILSVSLVACGTPPGGAAQQQSEGGMFGCKGLPNSQAKNATIGAVAGAVVGGLIGNRVADNRGVGTRNGALLGALSGALIGSQYKASISLTEMPDGSVKMNIPGSLLFETGQYAVRPEFQQTLNGVAKSLREYCGLQARVVGHTDNVGSDAINDKLSVERAQSVVSYLESTGVRPANLSAQGRGKHEPIASNDTAEGRAQNRRVEIFVSETN